MPRFRNLTERWFGPAKSRRKGGRKDRFEQRRLGRICSLESLESRELLTWAAVAANQLLTISEIGTPGSQGDTGVLKVDPTSEQILLDPDGSGAFQNTGANLATLAGPIQISAGSLVNSNFIIDNRDGAFFQPTGFSPSLLTPTFQYDGGTAVINGGNGPQQNSSLTVLGQTGIADNFAISNATENFGLQGQFQGQAGLLTVIQPPPISGIPNTLLVNYVHVTGALNLDGVDGAAGNDTLSITGAKADSWTVTGNTIQGPITPPTAPFPPGVQPPQPGTVGNISYGNFSRLNVTAPSNSAAVPTKVTINGTSIPTFVNGTDLINVNLNQPLLGTLYVNGLNGTTPAAVLNVNGSSGNDAFYVNGIPDGLGYQSVSLDVNSADRIQYGAPFTHFGADVNFLAGTVRTLNVAGMGGNNSLTVQVPPVLLNAISATLPSIVAFYGGAGPFYPANSPPVSVGQNLLRVFGNAPAQNTTGSDTIVVGDVPATGNGNAPIQMSQIQGVVIYGNGGNDNLTNNSQGNQVQGIPAVPGLLIGGSGNDTLTGGAGGDVLLGGAGLNVIDGDAALLNATNYLLAHQDHNGNIFDPYLQPQAIPGTNGDLSTIQTGSGNDVVVTGARPSITFGDPGDIDNFTATQNPGGTLIQLATVDPQNPTSSLYQVTPALLALEQAFGVSAGPLPPNAAALLEFGGNRNLRSQFATFAAFTGRAYNDILIDRKGGLGTAGVVSTGEIDYWVGQAQRGLTVQQMQAQLLASDELRQSLRLSNAWVRSLFQTVLGRQATPDEINAYLAPLLFNDTAATRYQLALSLLNSAEGTNAAIGQMYQNLVPRGGPSGADILAIQADLASGLRMEQVAQLIAASNGDYFNYVVSHNLGEVGFIGGLYQSALGRGASSGDIAFWIGVHTTFGVSNSQIAQAILNSNESRTRLLQSYYQTYLHRGLDVPGLNYWLGAMAAGMSPEQVLAAFVASPEYFANNGGTSDSFIRAMYRDVLRRATPPSQPELDYWIAVMAASTRGAVQARADVVIGFATSDENRSLLINDWYLAYLGRPASAFEINNSLQSFHLGASQVAVQAQILLNRAGVS